MQTLKEYENKWKSDLSSEMPITNTRKTMTARDAPNFHVRNATETGAAF